MSPRQKKKNEFANFICDLCVVVYTNAAQPHRIAQQNTDNLICKKWNSIQWRVCGEERKKVALVHAAIALQISIYGFA